MINLSPVQAVNLNALVALSGYVGPYLSKNPYMHWDQKLRRWVPMTNFNRSPDCEVNFQVSSANSGTTNHRPDSGTMATNILYNGPNSGLQIGQNHGAITA
jgi:hypothetical protein